LAKYGKKPPPETVVSSKIARQDKKRIQKDINTKRLDLKLGNQQSVGLGSSEKSRAS